MEPPLLETEHETRETVSSREKEVEDAGFRATLPPVTIIRILKAAVGAKWFPCKLSGSVGKDWTALMGYWATPTVLESEGCDGGPEICICLKPAFPPMVMCTQV